MKRIFVVDDEELILKSLCRTLERSGHQVVGFRSAADLLTRLGEAPDLLICDYHLPLRDGLDIAAEVKRVHPATRTMILSGGFADERVDAALQSKVLDRFSSKPWRYDELMETVETLLGGESRL